MDPERLKSLILQDLAEILKECAGVYLYGSYAWGLADDRSDIDICLVAGENRDPASLQSLAWRQVKSGAYDIRIFEHLPLHLQIRIMAGGILLYAPDPPALAEYLYPWWKQWDDQRWYQSPIPGAP
jgi:predicted nucleotidyltransferase